MSIKLRKSIVLGDREIRERGLGTNREAERHWGIEKKDEEKQDLEIDFETPNRSSQNLLAACDQYM